jgi:signal transduction histidine kinase/ligand-binding sensor domain-containing protein/CheY-like chemotaxis protein/HPt (histidine-containing phosphotransfer) domain-containing protein
MKYFKLILIVILLASINAAGQKNYVYNFKRYANEQGLSQSQVADIEQDKMGRMWIATYSGGVTILDGITEKYINRQNGLPSFTTTSLFLDKNNNMWIGTGDGPCYYDGYSINIPVFTEEIKKLYILDIIQDDNGLIWLATDQGIWYSKNDTVYLADVALMQYPFFNISKQPETGNLWFSSGLGDIYILDKNEIKRSRLAHTGTALSEDFYFVNPNYFLTATTRGIYEYEITETDTILKSRRLNNKHVNTLEFDNEKQLWAGTDESGLYIFDNQGETQHITAYQGVGYNRIYKIFKDKHHNMWVGTDGAGVSLFKGFRFSEILIEEIYQPSFVMDLYIDYQENIWIASDGQGVVKISKEKNTLYNTKNGLSNNFTTDITGDGKGNIYVATNNGITVINNNTFKYLQKPNHLVTNLIESMIIDHKGRLWAGTYGHGVQCLNADLLLSSANGLSDDYLWDIFESSDHKIYAATDEGVNIIKNDKVIDTINIQDGLLSENVISIIEDKHNNMWFASEGGVSWYNGKKLIFYHIDELCNSNVIYSIIEDGFGRIMLGTENGIVILSADKSGGIHSTYQFSKNDGFFGIECNSDAVVKDKNDNIYWGTINGVTRHIPSREWHTKMVASPSLNSIELSDENENLISFADSISPWYNLPVNLILPANKNNLTIHFSAPEFLYSTELRYKYKLEGLDQEWSKPVKQNQVNYNHLAPGSYTFKLQTLHADFPSKPAGEESFSFIIETPIYQTWWFRTIIIALTITIVLLFWNYRIYALRQRKVKLQKLVRERTNQLSKQKNELEIANREIRRSAKLKEQFLANTSHEMRTPLNVIIGYSNLLQNSDLNNQQNKYVENIRSSGEHLKVIINDLLDLSKIEADKMELITTSFDYRRVIINTFNIFRIEAESKGIDAEVEIKRPIHKIMGDPVRLTQIISNLLRNAVKFTEKGSININTREEIISNKKLNLHIRIEDTGIGIPEDKTDKIFNSFTQVSGDMTRKYGGTGLGLSIVKKLVDLHQGTIKLDSKINKGTVFQIVLPFEIATEEKLPKTEKENIKYSRSLSGLSILIVDDNELNLSLAIETLYKFNNSIHTDVAYNGKEAIEKLEKENFDLIIMDIQMPVMDGYEATRKIRERKDLKGRVPILGMTAHAMKDERQKCLDLGMNEYLSKPFSPNELLNRIHLILNIEPPMDDDKPIVILKSNGKFKSFNIDKIKSIVGDSVEKEVKYLKMFHKNAPELLQNISNGLAEKDFNKVKVSAHSLKSTFRYYGADKLMEYSRTIEELAPNNEENAIRELVINLENGWKEIDAELVKYFEKANDEN